MDKSECRLYPRIIIIARRPIHFADPVPLLHLIMLKRLDRPSPKKNVLCRMTLDVIKCILQTHRSCCAPVDCLKLNALCLFGRSSKHDAIIRHAFASASMGPADGTASQ